MSVTIVEPTSPVKFARINCASGDTTVVAAVSGKKIRALGITFSCAAAVGVSFKSGSTLLLGPMAFDVNGGMDSYRGSNGIFCETASGEALVMTLSGTAAVHGSLMYQEVPA